MESGGNHVIHAYILFQNLVKSWGEKIHRSQIGMEQLLCFPLEETTQQSGFSMLQTAASVIYIPKHPNDFFVCIYYK